MNHFIAYSFSPEQTRQMGLQLGRKLTKGSILALSGDLGSGKTIFTQGIAEGLGFNPNTIQSPTFSLIQEHSGPMPLCHVDLYRLTYPEILQLGLEEYLESKKWIVIVEWADKAIPLFSTETLHVEFEGTAMEKRNIVFSASIHWIKMMKSFSFIKPWKKF